MAEWERILVQRLALTARRRFGQKNYNARVVLVATADAWIEVTRGDMVLILPYLYYPVFMGISAFLFIVFFSRKKLV